MSLRCFFLQPVGKLQRSLRRYRDSLERCGSGDYLCEAFVPLDVIPHPGGVGRVIEVQELLPREDPRWPRACAKCGYVFLDTDIWQVNCNELLRRSDTGEEIIVREAPPGAMYDAHWHPDWMKGFDGLSLMVILPDGHHWCVDSEASNCTRKGDRTHRCWCRHGEPPHVTVDKNGDTCAAGAGSILTPRWHGFLRNGMLVTG